MLGTHNLFQAIRKKESHQGGFPNRDQIEKLIWLPTSALIKSRIPLDIITGLPSPNLKVYVTSIEYIKQFDFFVWIYISGSNGSYGSYNLCKYAVLEVLTIEKSIEVMWHLQFN